MKKITRGNLTFVGEFSEASESQGIPGWEGCWPIKEFSVEREVPTEGWEDNVREVSVSFAKILHSSTQAELKLVAVNARIKSLENALEEVRSRAAVVVPIQSLVPEPFELLKPIQVLLQQSGEDFIASFLDANINASGDTQGEALTNLKDLIVGSFEALEAISGKLGPGPRKQLAVLKDFIKRS